MTYVFNQKPSYWVDQDGKSKVLFLQTSGYGVGIEISRTTGQPWFGQRETAKIPLLVKTNNPRAYFLDNHLFSTLLALEQSNHPYDIYVVIWAMWDNALLDADLADALKS